MGLKLKFPTRIPFFGIFVKDFSKRLHIYQHSPPPLALYNPVHKKDYKIGRVIHILAIIKQRMYHIKFISSIIYSLQQYCVLAIREE